MVAALEVRTDRSAGELRASAQREKDPHATSRMYAIASALDGFSRTEAARLAGMERQALYITVVRYSAPSRPESLPALSVVGGSRSHQCRSRASARCGG